MAYNESMRARIVQPRIRRAIISRYAVAAALVLATQAIAEQEVFTPHRVAKIRRVTDARISPDGAHIAYLLSVPRQLETEENGRPWSELHVVDMSGVARPFVFGRVNVDDIRWTPDGRAISFIAKRGDDENKCLYKIPIDGGEARQLLCHETDIKEYAWAPDGKRVAFIAKENLPEEKKKQQEKGFDQKIFEEDYQQPRLWTVALDKDDAAATPLDLPGSPSSIHWSPAGAQIAVALAPTPLIDDKYMRRKVHVFDADTGEQVVSFDNPGKLGQIEWSRDGTHLAVISAEDLHDPRAGRLMVASVADGTLIDILPGFEGHVWSVAWQDADTIMFLGNQSVWTTLEEIRRDGTGRKTIVPSGKMVLSDLTLRHDGQGAAMISQSPTHAHEVYAMAHGDTKPRRLTNSNPWFANMRFAPQEVITHESRDGLRLEGLLIRPLDEVPGKRYPLILTVHGGPEGHRQNGWLTRYISPGQVGAARGFAVFYPNYRGSTGRGVAFSKLGQADYAGGEFDDLVDAVDHLIEIGLVDKDRVGVTGGSYGGYAAAWCATYYSDRFAASVMFVGISNLLSKAGTTDIPEESYLVHARRRVWESWDFLLKRSPIYHVEKAHTPILIMGGEDDPRVYPEQSLQMYRYLKMLDQAPVRYVIYPGEKHGNRKAASRLDYNLRMMRWLEHYLKGPGGEPPPYELDYELTDDEDDR